MPLTQPLIFCDLWQSGTALGEMVGDGTGMNKGGLMGKREEREKACITDG